MREAIMEIREEHFTKSAKADHGFEHVLASHVRRRGMSIKDIQNQWSLTDGEARGVMYAQASRATLRKIVKSPNGGWELGLMLLSGVIGHDLNTHIERKRAHERASFERMDAGLRKMAADLPAVLGLDGSSPL
jgi:hypothetical protein